MIFIAWPCTSLRLPLITWFTDKSPSQTIGVDASRLVSRAVNIILLISRSSHSQLVLERVYLNIYPACLDRRETPPVAWHIATMCSPCYLVYTTLFLAMLVPGRGGGRSTLLSPIILVLFSRFIFSVSFRERRGKVLGPNYYENSNMHALSVMTWCIDDMQLLNINNVYGYMSSQTVRAWVGFWACMNPIV